MKPSAECTVDELVQRLFRAQEALDPDADPGDLTILVQDDMPLVEVTQFGRDEHRAGGTVFGVLRQAVDTYEHMVAQRERET